MVAEGLLEVGTRLRRSRQGRRAGTLGRGQPFLRAAGQGQGQDEGQGGDARPWAP